VAFRDDRDAQLERAAALERENARLKHELARRERADAERAAAEVARSAEVEARSRELGSARQALDRDNAALREQLARARGPGLARRVLRRIAALKLPEPRGDGGFARAALVCWRLYVPVLLGLAIPAMAVGTTSRWALVGFALGAPVLAVLVLLVPWALGRRRRGTAATLAGAALGVAASAAFVAPAVARDLGHLPLHLAAPLVATVLLLVTRTARGRELLPLVLFTPLLALPHPGHIWAWVACIFMANRLATPETTR